MGIINLYNEQPTVLNDSGMHTTKIETWQFPFPAHNVTTEILQNFRYQVNRKVAFSAPPSFLPIYQGMIKVLREFWLSRSSVSFLNTLDISSRLYFTEFGAVY
jgi:hypothetical protein